LKERIKESVLSLGADICGVAGISGFCEAPEGFRPADIFPGCESVIVFGVALPKGLAEVEPRIIYGHYCRISCTQADLTAFKTAKEIERAYGGRAVPLPSEGPYEYWDCEKLEGRGLISMKHAAVLAGLGTLGKSTLLLNERYGNMLTLGAVLTDLKLDPDPPAESICVEGCGLCIENCPVHALDGISADQAKCRRNTYGKNARGFDTVNCNRCRTVCPVMYGVKRLDQI